MELSSVLLFGNAAVLGFRHGIDWDHIAAIMDIVGTNTTSERYKQNSFDVQQGRALALSTFYACGHASVVLILGIAALTFAAILPKWVDPIMERFVGITLLMLGGWVFYSLFLYLRKGNEFELKSRWMLIFALVRKGIDWLTAAVTGRVQRTSQPRMDQFDARTAFGVGMIHGIGAETGTQVLLIAAVGGASSQGLGIMMLLSFVFGLLVSNTIVAVLGSFGFMSSARSKSMYVVLGAIAGLFSLTVGTIFVSGQADRLPDLHCWLASPAISR
jgi:high-affinity nickel permease